MFVYPDSGDKWIDESAELDVVPSLEPNVAAEENARRFAEQGGVGVVLRFGYFYGPGAIHTEEILKFARLRFAMQLGGRNAYQAAIHLSRTPRPPSWLRWRSRPARTTCATTSR